MSKIQLDPSTNMSLFQLQGVNDALGKTQENLNTGLAINSPADGPLEYFTAQALRNDAEDYGDLKKDMELGIKAVEESLNGIDKIVELVNQAKGLINDARANSANAKDDSETFDVIRAQIKTLSEDTKFNGKNLIGTSSANLVVNFNPDATSKITFTALVLNGSAGASNSITQATSEWATTASIDAAEADVNAALDSLRAKASVLGAKLAIVQARLDFTNKHIENDTAGADNLVVADTNAEGARMRALQFRQNMGIQNIINSSNAQMSVLRLVS